MRRREGPKFHNSLILHQRLKIFGSAYRLPFQLKLRIHNKLRTIEHKSLILLLVQLPSLGHCHLELLQLFLKTKENHTLIVLFLHLSLERFHVFLLLLRNFLLKVLRYDIWFVEQGELVPAVGYCLRLQAMAVFMKFEGCLATRLQR